MHAEPNHFRRLPARKPHAISRANGARQVDDARADVLLRLIAGSSTDIPVRERFGHGFNHAVTRVTPT